MSSVKYRISKIIMGRIDAVEGNWWLLVIPIQCNPFQSHTEKCVWPCAWDVGSYLVGLLIACHIL